MSRDNIILGVVFAALAAVILMNKRQFVAALQTHDEGPLPPTAIVGMSQTLENTDTSLGPNYLVSNRRYMGWPPLDQFLPTVTSGQIGQVFQRATAFVRNF